MSVDWGKIDEQDFKPRARSGTHTTSVESAEISEPASTGTMSAVIKFSDNSEYSFANARYSLSQTKDTSRIRTMRAVFMALGIPKLKAQEGVEKAEAKSDYEGKCEVYSQLLENAGKKHEEVEIACWESDRINPNSGKPYPQSGFTAESLAWMNGNSKPTQNTDTVSIGDTEITEEDIADISEDEIPF